MLKELADRSEPGLDSETLERLLGLVDFDQGAVGAVDLAAMRAAGAAPEWLPLVDVWHVSRDDWRMVREAPAALSVEFGLHETLDIRLQLACETETAAEQVREALDHLLGAMEGTAAGEVEGLTKKLLAGQITTAGAARFKRLLSAGDAALKARSSGVEGDVAWASTPWQGDLPALAVAALASIPELETSRLAAARVIDEQNHQRLLQALTGYEKAEGALPFGAAEASLLPPETRLSWIATLLPYYDHLDWHDELNFARSWNDAANSGVTRRPLESVINPALGPSSTKAGFPVTHYVGLAGAGPDAALLEPTDPRRRLWASSPGRLFPNGRRRLEYHRGDGRIGQAGRLGLRRRRDRPPVDPAAIYQWAGRIWQRAAQRHAGWNGRRFGALPVQRYRPRRAGSLGDHERRRKTAPRGRPFAAACEVDAQRSGKNAGSAGAQGEA